jgi:hypothetical protein
MAVAIGGTSFALASGGAEPVRTTTHTANSSQRPGRTETS